VYRAPNLQVHGSALDGVGPDRGAIHTRRSGFKPIQAHGHNGHERQADRDEYGEPDLLPSGYALTFNVHLELPREVVSLARSVPLSGIV
jgi:hypothetical protein